MELSALCLIVAFGPVSIMCLKSLHEIEHLLRCVYRDGADGHTNVAAEQGSDNRGDCR